jgi:aryl-alcohol dehydrogenase-like predicted oxidoreductase
MRIGLAWLRSGPGYVNLRRDSDPPCDRSADVLRQRFHELLDHAYAGGVRYVDVARSYRPC